MKKIISNMFLILAFIAIPNFVMASDGSWYGDDYSYDSGSWYGDDYSYDSGSWYGNDYSYDNSSWYGDDYSYDSGSWYGDDYSYDSGSWYGDDYSYDSGSWYGDDYSYDTGSWYGDDYSYGGYDYNWYPEYGGYDYDYGYADDYYDDYGYYDDSYYGGGCTSNCGGGSTVVVVDRPRQNPPTPTVRDLDVICIVSDRTIDEGDRVTFEAEVTGGTGPFTYRWTGDFTSNNRSVSVRFEDKGTYSGTIRVTDSRGRTATDECDVRVDDDRDNEDFDAICVASDRTINKGDRVTFEARVEGGDRPYKYRWTGDGIDEDDQEIRVRFEDEGRYTVRLRVTDDEGRTATDECEVRVGDDDTNRDINITTGTLSSGTGTLASVGSVYLNQVPYTGPEEVAKGIAFVTLLLTFSAAAALIIRKKMNKNDISNRIAAFKKANQFSQN